MAANDENPVANTKPVDASKEQQPPSAAAPAKKEAEEELSEEDQKLKDELVMLVERLSEADTTLYEPALNSLTGLIRTSTSSMTAVPKPLKFLKPHYAQLVSIWEAWPAGKPKTQLAGIMSVLGMTQGSALHFRLLIDDDEHEELAAWGHEYLRHLALEIGDEYHRRVEGEDAGASAATGDLLDLSLRIVPYFLKHNAETDAVDLLLEVENIERITDAGLLDAETYPRVCEYLVACAAYLDTETAAAALLSAYTVYKQNSELPKALLLAVKLDDEELVRSVFAETQDPVLRKQLAFIVARQRRFYDLTESGELPDDIADEIRNTKLSEYFQYLAKELNLQKFKTPYEILRSPGDSGAYKVHGERSKMTLACTFVRGFLNAGYSNMAEEFPEISAASARTRASNASAVHTSLGLGYLWNYHEALQELDQYLESDDVNIKAGAILGVGVATTGVHDESDAALGLLADYVADAASDSSTSQVSTSAILSLGFAYAGTARAEFIELLEPLITDTALPIEVSAIAAVALGVIFVGSANGTVSTLILAAFIERDQADLYQSWAVFMGLGLALLYIGKADKIEAAIETVKAVEHHISQSLEILLVICAYAGSGNVLQIQRLLRETATRHYEDEDEDDNDDDDDDILGDQQNPLVQVLKKATDSQGAGLIPGLELPSGKKESAGSEDTEGAEPSEPKQPEHDEDAEMADAEEKNEEEDPAFRRESAKAKGLCTLGIGLISMGESIGEEMVMRHLEHLMHYGDSYIKQAVPLAMGLVSTSNPRMKVYETLSRYTHEPQFNVANNAIFALGLVGAGTVNARVAQLLRQLDEFYSRSSDLPFMSRFALGLVNLGKGTLTLSPFTAERQLTSPVSLAGLLIVSVALLMPPTKQFFISEHPSLLYALTLAIQPRMLVTVDEELKPLKVTVRVGQAVDTVGQAGKPKRITGWVTQDTPVLLSAGERAELESDEYEPLSPVLEGIVILRKKLNE